MIRRLVFVTTVAACGRVGFDNVPAPVPIDGPVEVAADLSGLSCETDHAIAGTLPAVDEIRILFSEGFPYVAYAFHISDTEHALRLLRLTERDGVLVGIDLGTIRTRPDLAGLSIEPEGTDHMFVFSEAMTKQTHVLRVDTAMTVQADNVVGSFWMALPPYARSTAGRMVAGVTATSIAQVQPLDATFAPSGPVVTLASPGYDISIAPAGADFIVGWSSSGMCQFARVDVSGAIVAGPISVVAGSECRRPVAAMLGSGPFAFVIHEVITTNLHAYAGTFDAALTTSTTPISLGTTPSFAQQLIVATDRARLPTFDGNTVRIAEITSAGTVSTIGSTIGTVAGDAMWIEQIAGASILFRVENRQLVIRKLCR